MHYHGIGMSQLGSVDLLDDIILEILFAVCQLHCKDVAVEGYVVSPPPSEPAVELHYEGDVDVH